MFIEDREYFKGILHLVCFQKFWKKEEEKKKEKHFLSE